MTRITLLKMVSIAAGAVCVASALANPAQAGTLGFDELPGYYFGADVPDGYGGFDWNLPYVNATSTYWSGIASGVVSPNIDRLRFTTASGGASMDDFTFAESTTATPVPTPAMLPSLVAMGGALWRKRKAKALTEASESV